MVNIGEILGEKAKNIVFESVEEGDVYRFRLTPEEGVVPKNKGDVERNKYFIVIGKDSQGNAFGFVLINSEVNQFLPKCRRDLHKVLKHQNMNSWKIKIDMSIALILREYLRSVL